VFLAVTIHHNHSRHQTLRLAKKIDQAA
jgi:hypothetical protein